MQEPCFPVNFAKYLNIPFLKDTFGRLILSVKYHRRKLAKKAKKFPVLYGKSTKGYMEKAIMKSDWEKEDDDYPETVAQRCSVKKIVLRNFAKFIGKQLCQSLFFNKVAGWPKKETLAQVFSCEFCEIIKNTFSTEWLPWLLLIIMMIIIICFLFTLTDRGSCSEVFCNRAIQKNCSKIKRKSVRSFCCSYAADSRVAKKWSFPLRVSSVNVTKSAVSCGFSQIYRKDL